MKENNKDESNVYDSKESSDKENLNPIPMSNFQPNLIPASNFQPNLLDSFPSKKANSTPLIPSNVANSSVIPKTNMFSMQIQNGSNLDWVDKLSVNDLKVNH